MLLVCLSGGCLGEDNLMCKVVCYCDLLNC